MNENPKLKPGPKPGSKRTERTAMIRVRCTPEVKAKADILGPLGVIAAIERAKIPK